MKTKAFGSFAAVALLGVAFTGTASADLHFDEGTYREANSAQKKALSRAANQAPKFARVTKHSAWYIGETDDRIGYVCGRRNGAAGGVAVLKRKGKWGPIANPTSPQLQLADYYCGIGD